MFIETNGWPLPWPGRVLSSQYLAPSCNQGLPPGSWESAFPVHLASPVHFCFRRAQDPCPSHHPLPSEPFLTWSLHPTSGQFSKHSQSTVSISKAVVATPLFQLPRSFPRPLGWSTDSSMELSRSPLLTSAVLSLFLPVPPTPRSW